MRLFQGVSAHFEPGFLVINFVCYLDRMRSNRRYYRGMGPQRSRDATGTYMDESQQDESSAASTVSALPIEAVPIYQV